LSIEDKLKVGIEDIRISNTRIDQLDFSGRRYAKVWQKVWRMVLDIRLVDWGTLPKFFWTP